MKVGKQLSQHDTPLYTGLKNTQQRIQSNFTFQAIKKEPEWILNLEHSLATMH